MGHEGINTTAWRRSSRCGANGCVEVAQRGDLVLVRDSKHPDTVLTFDREEWRSFIAGVHGGEFGQD